MPNSISANAKSSIARVGIDSIFHPELNSEIQSFVNKSKALSGAWQSNTRWPIECYSACADTVSFLKRASAKAKFPTLREVSEYIAKRRQEIAMKDDIYNCESIGEPRFDKSAKMYWTNLLDTPGERYSEFIAVLQEKVASLGLRKVDVVKLRASGKSNDAIIDENREVSFAYLQTLIEQRWEHLKQDQQEEYQQQLEKLQSYTAAEYLAYKHDLLPIWVKWFNDSKATVELEFDSFYAYITGYRVISEDRTYTRFEYKKYKDASELQLVITHTDKDLIPKIFNLLEPVFQEIMQEKPITNHKELSALLEKIGYMAWHLFHAMPYKRGSAAIQEILIRVILKFHGIRLPVYNQTISCDLLAIFETDSLQFSKAFASYFDWDSNFENNLFVMAESSLDKHAAHLKIMEFFSSEATGWQDCCLAFDYLNDNYISVVNAHKNPMLDLLFFKKNTTSWQAMGTKLAAVALEKLEMKIKKCIPEGGYDDERLKMLAEAREYKLFNRSLSNVPTLFQSAAIRKINEFEKTIIQERHVAHRR